MILAGLDLETLDTGSRSIIFEIGLEVRNYDPSFTSYELVTRFTSGMSFEEQLWATRTQDMDTLNFHGTIRGKDWFHQALKSTDYPPNSINKVLDEIRHILSDVDELWVNGLSFDMTILRTLLEERKQKPLLAFRKERDVRTVYQTIPAFKASDGKHAAHRAIEDAQWNLDIASRYHKLIQGLTDV